MNFNIIMNNNIHQEIRFIVKKNLSMIFNNENLVPYSSYDEI